jgi:hypothetical protein
MTVDRIRRRLDRLAELTAAARLESISSTLDRVHAAMARGEYKAPALDPPPPDGASRRERETWRMIAHADARVMFLRDGRSDDLRAAYAMSDGDLWQTLTARDGADLG